MDLLYSKAVSGVVVFLLTLIGGIVPFSLLRPVARHASRRTGSRLNLLQSGACGVFIATCLLHLLPEARESLGDALESDLPVSEMIVSFGFLLLLVLEQLLLASMGQDAPKTAVVGGGGGGGGDLVESQQPNRSRSVAVYRRKSSSKIATKASQQGSKFRSPNDAVTTYLNYGTVDDSVDIGLHPNGYVGNGNDDVGCDSNSQSDQETEPLLDSEEEEETVITQTGPINREDATNGKTRRENEQTQHGDGSVEAGKAGGENEVDSTAVLKSFVLMLALSLHTVFDGLVIGLQESERDVWTLLAAIGLHKTLIAVSISLSLLVSHRSHPRATLVYLFLFSLVAPLGVLIGTVLTETDFDEHAQADDAVQRSGPVQQCLLRIFPSVPSQEREGPLHVQVVVFTRTAQHGPDRRDMESHIIQRLGSQAPGGLNKKP
nr:hypothetical protein BaRGS_028756 [Batillaria attramentaria]